MQKTASKDKAIFTQSFNIDANGTLPRLRYNPALYSDTLARELDQEASLYNHSPNKKIVKNSLGSCGNFSNVIKELPIELMLETRVYGPAYSQAERDKCDTLLYDDEDEDDIRTRSLEESIISRDVDQSLIRDDIMFMSTLEMEVRVRKQTIDRRMLGTQYDRSKILTDNHLAVKDQINDCLVRIDNNGAVVKEIVKPCVQILFQDENERSHKLDQRVNTKLCDALKEYKAIFHSACKDTREESQNEIGTKLHGGSHRHHRVMLLPLLHAFRRKYNSFVRKHKLERNFLSDEDRDLANILLCEAIDDLNIKVIEKTLKEGADVNFVMNGSTAFQTIYRRLCKMDCGEELRRDISGHEKVSSTLIEWGSDLNSHDCEHSWNGFAPIHYAVRYGHQTRLQWLIDHDARIDCRTKAGTTPLMIACERGRFECVFTLVDNGADFYQSDQEGRTCLHYAGVGGNVNVLQFLVKCGSQDKLAHCNPGELPISISRDTLTRTKVEI